MSVVGVAEAAAELGVSERRVRQMLADGVLAGDRVGRTWVIEPEQLRRIEHRRPEVGRPWSPASAWAVLALADGGDPDLSPVERSRARKRLAQGLDGVAGRLAARAELRQFYAHPSVLDRLAEAPTVVRGGISAVAEHGADLVAVDGFEGYVRAGDLDKLVAVRPRRRGGSSECGVASRRRCGVAVPARPGSRRGERLWPWISSSPTIYARGEPAPISW